MMVLQNTLKTKKYHCLNPTLWPIITISNESCFSSFHPLLPYVRANGLTSHARLHASAAASRIVWLVFGHVAIALTLKESAFAIHKTANL